MGADIRGTFVIPWSATEIDGLAGAPTTAIRRGAVWRWRGEAQRIDGPGSILRLGNNASVEDRHRHATRAVHRLVGQCGLGTPDASPDEMPDDRSFTVSDGISAHVVHLIYPAPHRAPLLMFVDDLPPQDRDLWVVELGGQVGGMPTTGGQTSVAGGMLCFAAGTMIATPNGPRPVEHLVPGERVDTVDDGPQEVIWTGSRRISGARLFAMPELRPVRLCAGALGGDETEDILVSPDHQMLVGGGRAETLFGETEILVRARDLIDGRGVFRDFGLRETRYVHLLLPRHSIVLANGWASESLHPAQLDFERLRPTDRAGLLAVIPEILNDSYGYGPFARRCLSQGEAAILRHKAA